MNTPLIALGCELEKLLQLAISSYVDYTKRLPGARDNTSLFDSCLHGNCRDSRYPNMQCEVCKKACDGMLGDAMGMLVRSRRADKLSNYAPAAGGRQLPTAADINGVLDIVTQLHDLTNAVATGAPSMSSDTIEPVRTGTRNKRKAA